MKSIYWEIRIALLSLRGIWRLNLGDRVIYRGQKMTLIQGVGSPIWDMVDGVGECHTVNKALFRKSLAPQNLWRGFRFRQEFYRTSWKAIWMRQGIRPWMLPLKIW